MHRHLYDDYVCGDCFSDDGLKAFILSYAQSNECSFCGITADEPVAAPVDEVVEHINRCIGRDYEDPANSLPYESAEGGYQGITYTNYELFDEIGLDFPNDRDDRLRDAVCLGLDNDLWSNVDPFGLSRAERLRFSWDKFCRVIKHRRRYFFLQHNNDEDSELYSPTEILNHIFSYAEDAGAFVTLPEKTLLYRARHQLKGKIFSSAGTLGPPPVEHAVQTNRMSPAGIVMMYASEDKITALAETVATPGAYAVGEFTIERDALILDLTRLPAIPSIFAELPDSLEYDPRPRLAFLHGISKDISRSIERDDRVHIEYVPTQVVTEYVRTMVEIDGKPVEGIRYWSSRQRSQTALVLFADQEDVILEKDEQPEFYHFSKDRRWIRLSKASVVNVTMQGIKKLICSDAQRSW